MKLTLSIDMDNAAFDDSPGAEASRILHRLADKVGPMEASDALGTTWPLMDINGNKVGRAEVVE